MVSVDKVEKGIAAYLDAELMPKFNGGGLERVLVGTVASLVVKRIGTTIASYKDHGLVKMLGIMDDAGSVDIDTLTTEVKKNIAREGFAIDLPVIGTLTFHSEDIDKLHKFIKEA